MVFKHIKLVELSEQGSVQRTPWDEPFNLMPRHRPLSHFSTVNLLRVRFKVTVYSNLNSPLVHFLVFPYGPLIHKMIVWKTSLSSRHAHISSKEYFEETYWKFSKWISNGSRTGGWFWFGTPVLRVSLVTVAVPSIFSPKRRLFESIGFSRLPRKFLKYGTYLVIHTLAAMSRDNLG